MTATPKGALVLAEVDCFLRDQRAAMRKLIAEIFDPGTRYEYALPLPLGTMFVVVSTLVAIWHLF